jgi:hypothetical protein
MKKLLASVGVAITAISLLIGCGTTPKQIAYKSLSSVGAAANATGDALAAAYVQGKLSEAQWASAQEKYAKFQIAYNNACREAAYSLNAPASDIIVTLLNDWIGFANNIMGGAK